MEHVIVRRPQRDKEGQEALTKLNLEELNKGEGDMFEEFGSTSFNIWPAFIGTRLGNLMNFRPQSISPREKPRKPGGTQKYYT